MLQIQDPLQYPEPPPPPPLPPFCCPSFSPTSSWSSSCLSSATQPAAADRFKVISPWTSMASHWFQPWLSSRSSLAASHKNVTHLVDLLHQCRAHHSTGDPNTWPSSRPGLAAHGRDSSLPLVDHLRNIGSPTYHASLRTMVSSTQFASTFFFCSLLLECDLLAKKIPGRTLYSQHIIIRNWT